MSPIRFALISSLALFTIAAVGQEGDRVLITQTLVHADSKADVIPDRGGPRLRKRDEHRVARFPHLPGVRCS